MTAQIIASAVLPRAELIALRLEHARQRAAGQGPSQPKGQRDTWMLLTGVVTRGST